MTFREKINGFLEKYFFNPKWKCLSCGKEIFNGENFCKECKKELPFNDKVICAHCGREIIAPEDYCLTCKDKLTSIDLSRSAFTYKPPISTLIKELKYKNRKYLADILAEYLALTYFKNLFAPDFITFVPMTKKSMRKRKYNQSMLLANGLSKRVNVIVKEVLIKKEDTARQVQTKSREERFVNLKTAFKVIDKKSVKDKKILIVDDVTTTGATGEILAEKLKSAGAKTVYLLTVASVPPIQKY
jgi:competence protein ComFC